MISVRVYADEVILRLDLLPKRIRSAISHKFDEILFQLHQKVFEGRPGKFLDPAFVRVGTEQLGSAVVGFIEADEKQGIYEIVPNKARALRFIAKSGDLVVTQKVYRHPFLKAAPTIARLLEEEKPWIIDQIEDAVIEAM